MKFKKIVANFIPQFRDENDEIKIVNYGGKIYAFKKIDCVHSCGLDKGKKYRAFGNAIEKDSFGNARTYKNYRHAMKQIEKIYS
jgi:uncharacterized Ntn-hydrolase superfamily protein